MRTIDYWFLLLDAIVLTTGLWLFFYFNRRIRPLFDENTGDPYCPQCHSNLYYDFGYGYCPHCKKQRIKWKEDDLG